MDKFSGIYTKEERDNLVKDFLNRNVRVIVDRPIGYVHKKEKYDLIYPINYGYIEGVLGGDGEELDVYILGVDKPIDTFQGRIIGIVYRENDVEDKLVAAPSGQRYTPAEIAKAVEFQEKYYRTHIESNYELSCGAGIWRRNAGKIEFLLLLQKGSGTWSFPKGHIEYGETERVTAVREIEEEIGVKATFFEDFSEKITYPIRNGTAQKTVKLFLSDKETRGEDIRLKTDEIPASKWVDAKTAKELLPFRDYGQIVDNMVEKIKSR